MFSIARPAGAGKDKTRRGNDRRPRRPCGPDHDADESCTEAAGLPSWHPSGSVVAFAMSEPGLFFRGPGARSETSSTSSPSWHGEHQDRRRFHVARIADPNRLESFPAWSADGKTLYFCTADRSWGRDQPLAIEDLKKVKYDLMRVRYDIEKDAWGEPEPVLTAAETGLSISEPRASPDGRYLLFCMSAYGGFSRLPAQQRSVPDGPQAAASTGGCSATAPASESWHCWSSNSRWIVFSSKRDNGLAGPAVLQLY